jgi:hypothetical protein
MRGAGLPVDTLKAIEWLRIAARSGHVYSQFELGEIYRFGRGVEVDIEEARKWYVMAAEIGSPEAERAMEDLGMTPDVDLAKAEKGDAESQYDMGMWYLMAEGAERDLSLAHDWLLKSALNGNLDAMCEVGLLYYAGLGVEEDLVLAKHFWQRAADLGHSESIDWLNQPVIKEELGNVRIDSVIADFKGTCSGGIAPNKVRVRPVAADDSYFGYLKEQILLVQNTDVEGVSALRVPEAVGWLGKKRVGRPVPQRHPYQVGQKWRCDGRRLYYENCPLTYFSGPSPGTISCSVGFLTDEIIKVRVTLTASTEGKIEQARCHFCFNHRRAPLLGRGVFARAGEEWVDFERYVSESTYQKFNFSREESHTTLPAITERALYSESEREGMWFGCAIWSRHAEALVSNWMLPCTDVKVDFGDIEPGASVTRVLFVGVGPGGRDEWRKRVGKIPTE